MLCLCSAIILTSPLEGEVGAEGAGRGVAQIFSLEPPSPTLPLKGGGSIPALADRTP